MDKLRLNFHLVTLVICTFARKILISICFNCSFLSVIREDVFFRIKRRLLCFLLNWQTSSLETELPYRYFATVSLITMRQSYRLLLIHLLYYPVVIKAALNIFALDIFLHFQTAISFECITRLNKLIFAIL